MARRSDLAVVRFLFSRRLGVSLAPRETQPEIQPRMPIRLALKLFVEHLRPCQENPNCKEERGR